MMKILWWGIALDTVGLILYVLRAHFPQSFVNYVNGLLIVVPVPLQIAVVIIFGIIYICPAVISLGVLPVVDLVFVLPTIIRSDIHRGFFSVLAAVPVRSVAITADTRGWAIRNTLVHIIPGLVWLIIFWLNDIYNYLSGYYPMDALYDLVAVRLPMVLIITAGWFLLMNIIVLSSFRAKILNPGCLVITLIFLHIILVLAINARLDYWLYLSGGFGGRITRLLGQGWGNRNYIEPLLYSVFISLGMFLPSLFYRWLQKFFVDWLRQDRVV